MINYDDTIAAIATAASPAGIGIIRVSGDNSIKIVSSIFVDKNKNRIDLKWSHKVYYGFIYDDNKKEFIDEVIILTMFAPKSYTAEDVVEVQCHGGLIVLRKILNLIIEKGARIAEPGEFTKRAFLNRRIDLSKAEAVTDIIMSKNEYALKASFAELKGNLADELNNYRKELLESIAFIEACLDDPEHMDIEGFKGKLKIQIEKISKELKKIIDNYSNGKIIREGIDTVILGKPNVGKSSLLNILLDEERAIVSKVAGTTRDIIKESINLNGLTINLVDTAGIRDSKNVDEIEKIGIEKAKEMARHSNLILLVMDVNDKIDEEDKMLIKMCKELNKKYIIISNKIDIKKDKSETIKKLIEEYIDDKEVPVISFSTKDKSGFDELKEKIEKMFIDREIDFNNEIFISNERQLHSIKKAEESLQNVLKGIKENVSEDFLTIDMMDAYNSISQVLGIEVTDDVVDEIFSKFCMGK